MGSLRCTYPGLTSDCMASIMDQIQRSIRQKDDEMSWLDKSCLHLAVRRKDKTETLTFQVGEWMMDKKVTLMLQMRSPAVKQDWVVELRLARLALDPNNSPGWDILEQANTRSINLEEPNLKTNLTFFRPSTWPPDCPSM